MNDTEIERVTSDCIWVSLIECGFLVWLSWSFREYQILWRDQVVEMVGKKDMAFASLMGLIWAFWVQVGIAGSLGFCDPKMLESWTLGLIRLLPQPSPWYCRMEFSSSNSSSIVVDLHCDHYQYYHLLALCVLDWARHRGLKLQTLIHPGIPNPEWASPTNWVPSFSIVQKYILKIQEQELDTPMKEIEQVASQIG